MNLSKGVNKKFNKEDIKHKISKNRNLIKNFSFLSILQVFNLVLPLIAYPYLIRVLGKELYGLVIFVQAIIAFFTIVVNFGFNIYATKYVAINSNRKEKLSEIISAILSIKFVLFLLCILGLYLLSFFINHINNHFLLYLFSFGTCLGELVFPIWYFQGVQKMKYITYIQIFTRLIFVILIFILIHTEDDYLFYPAIQSLGFIISGVISIYVLFIKHSIKFRFLKVRVLTHYFIGSLPFFISRLSSVLKEKLNTLIIGTLFGMGEVSYYDLATKIVNLLIIPFNIINQTIYPSIAKSKNMFFVKQVIKFNIIFGIIIYLLLVFFSEYIILILAGVNLLEANGLVVLLGLMIPFSGITFFLGNTALVVMGHEREFNRSVVYGAILYLVLVLTLYSFNILGLYQIIVVLLICTIFEILYRYYYCLKYKLFKK